MSDIPPGWYLRKTTNTQCIVINNSEFVAQGGPGCSASPLQAPQARKLPNTWCKQRTSSSSFSTMHLQKQDMAPLVKQASIGHTQYFQAAGEQEGTHCTN